MFNPKKILSKLSIKSFVLNLNSDAHRNQIIKEILLNALFVQFLLEILNQRSILLGLATPFNNPIMFICSIALLSSFLSLGLLLPKRHLGYMLVNVVWLWVGAINFILLGSRTTPLTGMDFKMLTSVFTVIGRYLNLFELALFFVAVVVVIALLVYIGFKMPRTKWNPLHAIIGITLSFAIMIGSFTWAKDTGNVSTNFGNIADAYKDYGLAYSFATSVIDKGINKPASYSTDQVNSVINSMNEALVETTNTNNSNNKKTPNIIFVQLESFFDAKRINALSFSEDPIPNITSLRENYSSGYVTVPSIGAGTVNTEFEILTGMNLDYFGAGEYPYKTILSETTVESYAYDLSELGYHTQAIHNNMGTFYSRNTVYPKLGFDGFTSIEYMSNVEYNELGWADDSILVPEIINTLASTEQQDFIFTVSVQAHGKYPDYKVIENPAIDINTSSSIPPMDNVDLTIEQAAPDINSVTPTEESSLEDSTYYKYLYYVNQIHGEDAFVGELIAALEDYSEPVIVVFYGDHLPTLDITAEDLSNGSPFQTEYVMWDNIGLERIEKDYNAYQLGSMVMQRLGYTNGLLNKYHQEMVNKIDYETELELLQYDVLYGNKDAYNGINPYLKKTMMMGVNPITVSGAKAMGEAVFVTGYNFTKWSEVYFNGKQKNTIYLDENTLIVTGAELTAGMKIKVSQVTDTGKKLSTTLPFIVGDASNVVTES